MPKCWSFVLVWVASYFSGWGGKTIFGVAVKKKNYVRLVTEYFQDGK